MILYPFKVEDLNSGKVLQSGRKSSEFLNKINSHKIFYNNLIERRTIEGTPETIENRPILNNNSHLGKNFIRIKREVGNSQDDSVYIPDRLRITLIGGTSAGRNTILYCWLEENELPINLRWRVLFANTRAQTRGDFIDIDLPDTNYKYIGLCIINNGWLEKTVLNTSEKLCSLKKLNILDYYTINPSFSRGDKNKSHSINLQSFSNNEGINTRILITFEDWNFEYSDRDYNDVILSLSSVSFDENEINDNQFR